MYPETINELINIIEKSKLQYEEINQKQEERLVRKRVRDGKDNFVNRFKNKVRNIFDNTSQK